MAGDARSIENCVTLERANELVRYDPITGLFYDRRTGDETGSLDVKSCYIRIFIDGKLYQAHRVAHLLMNGEWPNGNPDHYDTVPFNNCWNNICDLANEQESHGNTNLKINNASGLKGVNWDKRDQKWRARIGLQMERIHLGHFSEKREAGLTYDAAAKLVWAPRFQRLNFPSWESKDIILSPHILRQIGKALEQAATLEELQ